MHADSACIITRTRTGVLVSETVAAYPSALRLRAWRLSSAASTRGSARTPGSSGGSTAYLYSAELMYSCACNGYITDVATLTEWTIGAWSPALSTLMLKMAMAGTDDLGYSPTVALG